MSWLFFGNLLSFRIFPEFFPISSKIFDLNTQVEFSLLCSRSRTFKSRVKTILRVVTKLSCFEFTSFHAPFSQGKEAAISKQEIIPTTHSRSYIVFTLVVGKIGSNLVTNTTFALVLRLCFFFWRRDLFEIFLLLISEEKSCKSSFSFE